MLDLARVRPALWAPLCVCCVVLCLCVSVLLAAEKQGCECVGGATYEVRHIVAEKTIAVR